MQDVVKFCLSRKNPHVTKINIVSCKNVTVRSAWITRLDMLQLKKTGVQQSRYCQCPLVFAGLKVKAIN